MIVGGLTLSNHFDAVWDSIVKDFYFNPEGAYAGVAFMLPNEERQKRLDVLATYPFDEIWGMEEGEHPLDHDGTLYFQMKDNTYHLPNVMHSLKAFHRNPPSNRYWGIDPTPFQRGGSHFRQHPRDFNNMGIGVNLGNAPHDFEDALRYINENIEHEEIHRGTVPELDREGLDPNDSAYERIVHALMEAAR